MNDKKTDIGSERPKVVKMEYPSNSHKTAKPERSTEKKIEKITSGKVVQKKKTLGKKFVETFLGDDLGTVVSYVIHDVLIPAAKSMINDTISGGTEMLLFGETRKSKGSKGRSYVSYDKASDRTPRREVSSRNRAQHNFDDIVLESRGEAGAVLDRLVDLTEDYGMASVADLYELVGATSAFTDNKYGWTNLSDADIRRVRDGYMLILPKAILLD